MREAAIYARVSSNEQANKDISIPAQLEKLHEYASKNNIMVVKKYIDDGISGKSTEKREQFLKMIAEAKQDPKPFDTIIYHKNDRMFRNMYDAVVYKKLLREDRNIDLICISQDIDTNTPHGMFAERMMDAVAEYYSANLAEEVMKGMNQQAKKGVALGEPPYGYSIDRETGKYKVYEPEAEVLKYVFQQYIKGNSLREIGVDLRANGVNLFGDSALLKVSKAIDNKGKHNDQKISWAPKTVRNTLSNEVYIGNYIWNDTQIENNHPAIIDKDQFELVQELLKRNKKSKKNASKDYLLKGLVTCIECEGNLSQLTQRYKPVGADKEQITRKLRCTRHVRFKDCYPNYWSMEEVEQGLVSYLKEIIRDKVDISTLQINKSNNNDFVKELNRLEKKYKNFDSRFDKQMQAFEAGVIDLEQLQGYKKRLKEEKEEIEDRIAELEETINNTSTDHEGFKQQINRLIHTLENDDTPLNKKKNILIQAITEVQLSKRQDLMRIIFKF
ncbi:recombinase family protein [Orenia marismortui]|uniref:Site-specific DNA recombinase n=1 Tax=Orenia marismortui TaxID=46469 RepID=A0A4R8H9J1_9FIRM|nr:recombinase family protein [Orenia marismortui]TDX52184.1 site-specific DNA recombinase [Orenia marismortui]